jgi:LysM repeat protein
MRARLLRSLNSWRTALGALWRPVLGHDPAARRWLLVGSLLCVPLTLALPPGIDAHQLRDAWLRAPTPGLDSAALTSSPNAVLLGDSSYLEVSFTVEAEPRLDDTGNVAALALSSELTAAPAEASGELLESEPTRGPAEAPPPDEADARASVEPAAPALPPPPLVARIQTYRVAPGDSLTSLARRFGISVDTLRWANPLPDPDVLYVGHVLTILPVSGVLHTVAPGETVATVAPRYRVPAPTLLAANGLAESDALRTGQRLLVPGGRPLAVTSARGAAWPAAGSGARQKPQFIAAAAAVAQESQRTSGVPASVTIAQAILESNWGDSLLAREANNIFGIKAYSNPNGQNVYWMAAWEVVDGEDVVTYEPFRAYTSPEASFADHGRFFRQNPRYWPALRVASDPRAFAQGIADAGYATDPAYASKLIRLMDQYDLYQYDLR